MVPLATACVGGWAAEPREDPCERQPFKTHYCSCCRTGTCSPHLQRRLGQRLHAHKPLLPHERLHNLAAPLRPRHTHLRFVGWGR